MRDILPFVTVHLFSTNTENTKTSNRCVGGELDMKPVPDGTAVVIGITVGYGETVIGILIRN